AAAIMAIGERLGLEVVAEGIERPEQIESLQSLGFDLGQGFFFGRPMPARSTSISQRKSSSGLSGPWSPMQHSFEGLDRGGGFARIGLLRPLRTRDFRLLWAGMSVSLVGDGMFLVATAWTAYALWNAPAALSVIGIAMTA